MSETANREILFSLQVRKRMAQVIFAMARQDYLSAENGDCLVEFIVRQCALSDDDVVRLMSESLTVNEHFAVQ